VAGYKRGIERCHPDSVAENSERIDVITPRKKRGADESVNDFQWPLDGHGGANARPTPLLFCNRFFLA
jgi:hypothetical protein